MMNFIRQKLKFLMWFVAVFFVGGLFFIGGRAIGIDWIIKILPTSLLIGMPGCARSVGIQMKVNDYNVKRDEILRVQETINTRMDKMSRTDFDEEDINEAAIDSVTRYALLLNEANKYDIRISKAELEEGIRRFPYYMPQETLLRVPPPPPNASGLIVPYYELAKEDGKFNSRKFAQLLKDYGKISPKRFSKEVENGLRIARVQEILYCSAMVTDLEIQQEYRKQNEKATIKYVELQYKDFNDQVQIGDTELSDFFQKNILDYKIPDKVNIKFIKLTASDLENSVEVSEAEIQRYYENHKHDYSFPARVIASYILVESASTKSAGERAKDKVYAEEILKEARKPEADFAALANSYSKGPFKVTYKDLGPIERGGEAASYGPSFEEAVFALAPHEVSGVVETSEGYHIIKVESKLEAGIKSLPQVRSLITRTLKTEQAEMMLPDKAQEIWDDVMLEEDLQAGVDAEPDLKPKIQETGFFAMSDNLISNIGPVYKYKDVAEEAFNLKVNEFSNLILAKDPNPNSDRILGYFVFQLVGMEPGRIPELGDVKDDVIKDLKDEKARKLAIEKGKGILASRDPGDDLDEIAKKNDLEVKESEPFALSARGYIRGKLGSVNSKKAMFESFGLTVGEIAGPFEGPGSVYIIQLVDREKFDEKILFSMGLELQEDLENGILSGQIRQQFTNNNVPLPQNVTIHAKEEQNTWVVSDAGRTILYVIKKEDNSLNTYDGKKYAEDQEKKTEIREQLLRRKQQMIYDSWYQKVKSEAEIKSFMPEKTS